MTRTFFATLLSAALLVSPMFSAPARAANEDLARILGGVATFAIIGIAIKELRDKKKDRTPAVTQGNIGGHKFHDGKRDDWRDSRRDDWRENRRDDWRDGYRDDRRDHWRDDRHGKTGAHKRNKRIVPSACLRETRTRYGVERYYAKPCLRQTMRNVDRLPQQCEIRVNGGGRGNVGYAPRCLERFGWKRG